MRNVANDGADHRHSLICSIGPGTDDVADIIVNPFLAINDALALKPHREWIAVIDRAFEVELPSDIVNASLEFVHCRCFNTNIGKSRFQPVCRCQALHSYYAPLTRWSGRSVQPECIAPEDLSESNQNCF